MSKVSFLKATLLTTVLGALAAATPAMSAAAPGPQHCPRLARPAPALPPTRFEDGPTIATADLLSDFDGWMSGMRAVSPDLTIRADPAVLEREAARIRASIKGPMSRRKAWLRFALLNPYLGDGHAGIYMPDYRDALQSYVAAGGRIVPVDVRFASDGALRVFAPAPGVEGIGPGDRLWSINAHPTALMTQEMLRRAPGDTLLQRRAWVARRFAALYRILYGDTGTYDVQVSAAGSSCARYLRVDGATRLPVVIQPDPGAPDLFAWRIFDSGVGYLRIDSFGPETREALDAIAKQAFTEFTRSKIHALIIDVRENGGGDDPLWQQDVMEYITDLPYSQLSSFVGRVTQQNADPGDVIGTVKRAEYTQRITPTAANPLRFSGPVYILAGPFSYSATIQFMVAAQDFGIARIAGAETGALACQTGQVQRLPMPKSGLNATIPVMAYTRPSGAGCHRGVIPDLTLPVDEVMPERTLAALVAKLAQ
jgi:Peptidase family S41